MEEIEQKNIIKVEPPKREIMYDFIRAISCICVIGIHSIPILITNGVYDVYWWINLFMQAIVRLGLPMLTLISGALILNGKDEKISEFYYKRFIKIVIPLYIYSFIYIFKNEYNFSLQIFKPNNIIAIIKNITAGPVEYHLWYVYMIIGFYLCAPYLRKMCKSLSDNECKSLLILIFSISFIKYFLPSFNIKINIENFVFIEWTLIFLLGYLVTRENIREHYKIIYILRRNFIYLLFHSKKMDNSN